MMYLTSLKLIFTREKSIDINASTIDPETETGRERKHYKHLCLPFISISLLDSLNLLKGIIVDGYMYIISIHQFPVAQEEKCSLWMVWKLSIVRWSCLSC